jgi:aspartyl protease family protein
LAAWQAAGARANIGGMTALAALMLLQAAGLPPAPQWRADAPIPPPPGMAADAPGPAGATGAPVAIGGGEQRLARAPDGHFYVNGLVNGVGVRFVVDTGAGMVMLTPQDAARAGLKVQPADYRMQARTAGGLSSVAPVSLGLVAVGGRQVRDVAAVVSSVDTGLSLLGMSFLKHLKRVTIENDVMHLE